LLGLATLKTLYNLSFHEEGYKSLERSLQEKMDKEIRQQHYEVSIRVYMHGSIMLISLQDFSRGNAQQGHMKVEKHVLTTMLWKN
jgi:hypothetical protein